MKHTLFFDNKTFTKAAALVSKTKDCLDELDFLVKEAKSAGKDDIKILETLKAEIIEKAETVNFLPAAFPAPPTGATPA